MTNTENITNEANVNNQEGQEINAVATQQDNTPAQTGEKKGFFAGVKEKAKAAWNSKPAKVIKTVTLVAGGFAAGMLVANGTGKSNESDQAVADVDYSEAPAEDSVE